MSSLATLRELVRHPRVAAMARVVRQGETDQTERAYARVNGAPDITDFSRHPYEGMRSPPGRAAGAYQYIASTWGDFVKWARGQGEEPDFTPSWQDLGFVWLLWSRGALDEVLAGEIPAAVARLRPTWTSLPGAAENSGRYTMDKALAVYREYGGTIATQPAAPIEEAAPPAAPIGPASPASPATSPQETTVLPMLLPFVLGLVQTFAAPKIAQALTKQGATPEAAQSGAASLGAAASSLLTGLIDSAVTHTNSAPAVEAAKASGDELALAKAQITALVAARDDAVARAKVEADGNAMLDKLTPLIRELDAIQRGEWEAEELSRERAAVRARTEAWDMTRPLVFGALAVFCALMAFVLFVAGYQTITTENHSPTTEVWAAITGLIGTAGGVFLTIIAYRFGTSRSSAAKDELVAQLSARRPKLNAPAA